MTAKELKDSLVVHLQKPFNAKILLNTSRLINENDRKTSAYTDPNYIPFYYHLGKIIQPKNVLEIGLRLGLTATAFTRSCLSVEHYLALQESRPDIYYSARLAKANIRDHFKGNLSIHVGSITDDIFVNMMESRRWDSIIINDEFGFDQHLLFLEMIYPHVELGGWVICDYMSHKPAAKAWEGFCKSKNRTPEYFDTRYCVSIIQK